VRRNIRKRNRKEIPQLEQNKDNDRQTATFLVRPHQRRRREEASASLSTSVAVFSFFRFSKMDKQRDGGTRARQKMLERLAKDFPHLQREPRALSETKDRTRLCGYLLLVGTFLFCVICVYSTVLASAMPDTGYAVLDIVKDCDYYCLALPALIPVTFVGVYLNWVGFKYYRHNS